VAVAGLGISWLRDNLRIIDSADDSEPIAASVSGCRDRACPCLMSWCQDRAGLDCGKSRAEVPACCSACACMHYLA
jgi:hypothetical protein